MKRLFDFVLSLLALIFFMIPMLIIAIFVRLTSKGPALHWSKRIGQDNKIFLMPKFRSMKIDAPQLATHLIQDPNSLLTPIGGFLRKTSLDELPQLLSILKGDMSIVGPRPALFNQDDLKELRTQKEIHRLKPGLTGWAQINGRDDLPIPIKVGFDEYYFKNQNFWLDIKIIVLTFFKVFKSEGVRH